MESFKDQLKILLISKKMTMTQLVELLNEKYNRTDSVQNLANKLRKETIRYSEVLEIAEVLNCRIEWENKDFDLENFFLPTTIKNIDQNKSAELANKIVQDSSIKNEPKEEQEITPEILDSFMQYTEQILETARYMTAMKEDLDKKFKKLVDAEAKNIIINRNKNQFEDIDLD